MALNAVIDPFTHQPSATAPIGTMIRIAVTPCVKVEGVIAEVSARLREKPSDLRKVPRVDL